MRDFMKKFERFCLRNRDKGVRNLMLVIAIGNLAVYLLDVIDPSHTVYGLLYFSRGAILRGQVWRLVSFVFTYLLDCSGWNLLLGALSLYCYYQFGRILEGSWGVFRFNLYYFTGVLLCDIVALLFGYSCTASDLNLSLFLAVATIAPNARVLLLFIPIRMKYLAWVYLALTALNLLGYIQSYGLLSFVWLIAIVPLANYFLFFGKNVQNVLPDFMKSQHGSRRSSPSRGRPNPNWASAYRSASGEKPYRHKCTVCGKTDTDYPNLEFRYCSKCNGYYCYCMEHINNHAHIP